MIRRIDLRGSQLPDYRTAVPRADFDIEAAQHVVEPICESVRDQGEPAIWAYSAKFDGVDQQSVKVPASALATALTQLDPDVRAGLEESIRRLRKTCLAELESGSETNFGPGARVTQKLIPIDRVGLYVPGGLAPLVSSVVMNVVPAQVAGVRSIALTSSPQKSTAACRTRPFSPHARCLALMRSMQWEGRRQSQCLPMVLVHVDGSTWSPAQAISMSLPPSACSRV